MNITKKGAILFSGIGVLAGIAGTAALQTHAAGTSTATTTAVAQSQAQGFGPGMRGMRPAAQGKVTAVSGTQITVADQKSGTSFTVDASAAIIQKFTATVSGQAPTAPKTITVSDIVVGDTVGVQGTVTGKTIKATSIMDGLMGGRGRFAGHAPAGNDGNITAINGNTITMQEEADEGGASYAVDASNATVTNNGVASTVSNLKVGDKIFVQGTVTGTNVAATEVSVGHPQGHGPKMTQVQSQ